MQKEVEIFTDGSCLGNPGPGGTGIVLRYKQHTKTSASGYFKTTNNRMELMAVIEAFGLLKEPCKVTITSDSKYMRDGISKWIFNWKKNNWRTSNKKAVKNQDLWQRLDKLISQHEINWSWVKGHAGHAENELCDELARQAAENPTLVDVGYQPD